MKNTKFAFGKAYNITINGEGLDVSQADVEFSIMQEGYSFVLPLKHIKESVFELKIPAIFSKFLDKKSDIDFSISVKKDNLCFEVMKESFDLEYFKVSSVKIEEASTGETIHEETLQGAPVKEEEPSPKPSVVIAEKEEASPEEPAPKERDLKEELLEMFRAVGKKPADSQPSSSKPSMSRLRDIIGKKP